MPPRIPIEPVYIKGWDGGWNPDMPESNLEPNQLSDILNMQWVEGYALQKRKGYEVISDTVSGMDTPDHILIRGVQSIETSWVVFEQHVFYFNENDGAIYHATLANLVEDFASEGTGADLTDTGYARGAWGLNRMGERAWSINAVVVGDVVYITDQRQNATSSNGGTDETNAQLTNSVNKAFKYDVGSDTWSSVGNPTLVGDSSGFPAARHCIVQHNRVFAANLLSHTNVASAVNLDYRHPNRIYWSELDTPETWSDTSFITVGADDDGSEITSLIPFREGILVFKNQSVWNFVGTDTDTFALHSLSDNLGCEATYGAIADEDFCYFLDLEEGVMQYDGVRFTNISQPLNAELLGALNHNASFKTVLWLDENRLYVSIPVGDFASGVGDHATRTYVYDRDLKVWTRWSIGYVPRPTLYTQDTGNLTAPNPDGSYYGGGINDTLGVMKLESTNNDGGSAIDAYFETAWFNPGSVGEKHRLRRLETLAEQDGAAVAVTLYRNFDQASWKTGSFTPSGSHDGWHEQSGTYDGDWWSWLKFRLRNNTSAETFQINGLGFSYSTRTLLRNDLGIT